MCCLVNLRKAFTLEVVFGQELSGLISLLCFGWLGDDSRYEHATFNDQCTFISHVIRQVLAAVASSVVLSPHAICFCRDGYYRLCPLLKPIKTRTINFPWNSTEIQPSSHTFRKHRHRKFQPE